MLKNPSMVCMCESYVNWLDQEVLGVYITGRGASMHMQGGKQLGVSCVACG